MLDSPHTSAPMLMRGNALVLKTPVENAPRTSVEKHLSWSSDIPCHGPRTNKPTLFKVTEPSSVPYRAPSACAKSRGVVPGPPTRNPRSRIHRCPSGLPTGSAPVCVECLMGKQKKPMILFQVTEPSSVPSQVTCYL
jgi:hypothetical protein